MSRVASSAMPSEAAGDSGGSWFGNSSSAPRSCKRRWRDRTTASQFMYSVVPRDEGSSGRSGAGMTLQSCRVHVHVNALQGKGFLERLRAGAHARAPGQEEVCRGQSHHPKLQLPAIGEDVLAGLAGLLKIDDVPKDLHHMFDGVQRVVEGATFCSFVSTCSVPAPCTFPPPSKLWMRAPAAALPFSSARFPRAAWPRGRPRLRNRQRSGKGGTVRRACASGPCTAAAAGRFSCLDVRALGPSHVLVQAVVVLSVCRSAAACRSACGYRSGTWSRHLRSFPSS